MDMHVPPRVAIIASHDDRYRVAGALEIAMLLRGLITQHALVTAYGAGGEFFVTALLAAEESADRLVFDYGVDAALTERMLAGGSLMCVTQLDHVRIQFEVRAPQRVEYEDAPAFATPFPESLTRLQRREHYRLRVPRGRPLHCDFAVPVEEGAPERRVMLPVSDISCGGIALVGWPDGFLPRPGQTLADARIALSDLGTINADLYVVHVEGAGGRGPEAGRFGCRFVQQRPGDATLIQRYINRIERERRAML